MATTHYFTSNKKTFTEEQKLSKYLGYKFFKNKEDSEEVDLVRVIKIIKDDNKVKIKNCDTNEEKVIGIEELSGYTPLEPTGFVTVAKVGMQDDKIKTLMNYDVIFSLYRLVDIKLNINEPYAICRQSVNDFFYGIISGDTKELAGVCCSRENCPVEIPYYMMAACDEVFNFTMVHFYLTDTINDVLEMIDTTLYDKVLEKLYQIHMKTIDPNYVSAKDNRKSHDGWCRDLKTLLIENNVQTDMDTMRNVSAVDFDISDYTDIKDEDGLEVSYANAELRAFIAKMFRLNIQDKCIIMKYDVDIDLAEFNNTNYVLLRDTTNTTYIISYILDGEHRESDLIEEENKLSAIDKLRIQFYNKYSNQK